MKKADWFTDWFNTSYYHTLYKNRNDDDAQLFMRNITEFLQLSKTSYIHDLPCGKGRHSIYLNSLGYHVTGSDLSENSILSAKQFENDSLHFKVKDGFIIKHISFSDKGVDHSYTEKVKYIDLEKFENYFTSAGLKINHIFGDYKLSEFVPETSDRLIIVAS